VAAGCLISEEVLREEEDVRGALGEAAHEVGVPLGAEGDVDANAEALRGELALEVAADAVEHLELEGGLRDSLFGHEATDLGNDGFVVGGDAAEDGGGEHAPGELEVVGVDVGLGGEGYGRAFLVGSLAETDADALLEEASCVRFGAVEVRLENGADAILHSGLGVELLDYGEGGFGELAALHVDAEEAVGAGGVGDDLAHDAGGQAGRETHAHLGELGADVGVEAAGVDGVEELVVDCGGGMGLGFDGDALAEGVKGDGDAFAVDGFGGAEGVVDGETGYEAAREAAAERGTLREGSHGLVSRERYECRAQQGQTPE
jgi:hypothetical protein